MDDGMHSDAPTLSRACRWRLGWLLAARGDAARLGRTAAACADPDERALLRRMCRETAEVRHMVAASRTIIQDLAALSSVPGVSPDVAAAIAHRLRGSTWAEAAGAAGLGPSRATADRLRRAAALVGRWLGGAAGVVTGRSTLQDADDPGWGGPARGIDGPETQGATGLAADPPADAMAIPAGARAETGRAGAAAVAAAAGPPPAAAPETGGPAVAATGGPFEDAQGRSVIVWAPGGLNGSAGRRLRGILRLGHRVGSRGRRSEPGSVPPIEGLDPLYPEAGCYLRVRGAGTSATLWETLRACGCHAVLGPGAGWVRPALPERMRRRWLSVPGPVRR